MLRFITKRQQSEDHQHRAAGIGVKRPVAFDPFEQILLGFMDRGLTNAPRRTDQMA
ncbi:hypothetical protein D3C74_400370 [compost metagenome]